MSATENLPNEILGMIFNNLTFTEKLIARLVCQNWNEQLFVSSTSRQWATYHLNSKQSHQVFLDSAIPQTRDGVTSKVKPPFWKSLKVSSLDFMLPAEMKNRVTTLDLELKSMNFNDSLEFVLQFSAVRDLTINIPSSNTQEEDKILNDNFKEFARKLASISFRFPYNEFTTLRKFLHMLSSTKNNKLNLTRFVLCESCPPDEDGDNAENAAAADNILFSDVRKIISCSVSTLKILKISFRTDNALVGLVREVFGKLENTAPLKLTDFSIGVAVEFGNTDFLIVEKFLTSQKDTLKSMSLPYISDTELGKKFMTATVSKDIQKLEDIGTGHIIPSFSNEFQQLKSVSVLEGEIDMLSSPCPSIRRLLVDSWFDGLHDRFLENISSNFVNLTELVIRPTTNNFDLYNDDLQAIIKGFKKLRVLKLYSGADIGDYGVSGISNYNLEELIQTRRLYLEGDKELFSPYDPYAIAYGNLPISSLRNLEELILLKSNITDAGIYFGFRFPSLKKLTLQSTSEELSDWGLHSLAVHNPKLEAFHGIFKMERIRPNGTMTLKSKFPLIVSTQQLKLEGQE